MSRASRTGSHPGVGSTSRAEQRAKAERRLRWGYRLLTVVTGALVVSVVALAVVGRPGSGSADLPLPNPMGGPAIHAPEATGEPASFGGLELAAASVEMGDVPLNVTVVPSWMVTNPGTEDVTLAVGQPQVHEGCCPGPVLVDETIVGPGGTVTVPAGGQALVQFPLQMHPGMDGPHHLTVPLLADGEATDLHVTGNFTADA